MSALLQSDEEDPRRPYLPIYLIRNARVTNYLLDNYPAVAEVYATERREAVWLHAGRPPLRLVDDDFERATIASCRSDGRLAVALAALSAEAAAELLLRGDDIDISEPLERLKEAVRILSAPQVYPVSPVRLVHLVEDTHEE